MLSGPSTLFSYRPSKSPEKRRKPYGHPVVLVCHYCSSYIVGLYSPSSRRRVFVSATSFFNNISLVYSWQKHGPTHFCPQMHEKTPHINHSPGVRSPTEEPAPTKDPSFSS